MMNDDLQSYIEPELEARIVALVLGEASAFEAEELEKLIAERAELQAYRERLAKVHGVVGAAHREVNEEEWKLSTEKREAILSRYRKTAQAEVIEKKNQSAQRKTRRARRKLILACAACLLMTLTLGRFLMQGDDQKDAVALTSIKEEGVSREAMLAQMDADIIAQNDIVQNHRKDLTVLVQQYGIPYFDGSQSNPLGDSEQTMFRAARGKLADFETQKEEIEGQLKELVSKDNSDLVEYAAGLDLPENQVDHHFDQYRDSVNQRSGLLAQGLSEEHPDVLAASERAQTSMAGARKEATALKSVLETKLGLVNRQVESMKEMVDNRKSDTVDLSLRQHTYTQAKESYEQSREMLREMKMAKIRTGFGFAESESPGLSTDRASVREALSSLDAASPGIVTNFPVTPATPVMKVDKFSNGMGAALNNGLSGEKMTRQTPSAGEYFVLGNEMEESSSHSDSFEAKENVSSLAEQEGIRRQALVRDADDALIAGREAYAKGDYGDAVSKYKEAAAILPAGTATASRKEVINDHLSDGAIALTQKYRRTGQYEEARRLLEEVQKIDPSQELAAAGLAYLDDPIRTNPSLTYEHTKNVDKVRRNLYKGEGFYDLGLYDKAEEEFKSVIRIDPYNKAARRGLERTAAIKSDYYRADYDQTRAKMLMEVDREWELAVPEIGEKFDEVASVIENVGERTVTSKGDQIIIPEVDFNNTTVEEALDFVRLRSIELDNTTVDETQKGVNIVLEDSALLGEILPTMKLEDVPLRVVLNKIGAATGTSVEWTNFSARFSKGEKTNVFEGSSESALDRKTASKMNQIILPEIQIANSSMAEVLQFLSLRSEELEATAIDHDEPKGLKIKIDDPKLKKEILERRMIGQLRLRSVPLRVAIEEVARMTGCKVRLDDGKVVFFSDPAKQTVNVTQAFETLIAEKSDSTFSLNVSDVSFKLAKSSLAEGAWPEAAQIRAEEFVNALDYDDVKPTQSEKVANVIEQGAHPFIPQRNLMRVAMSTASLGRNASTPLRLTILLDQSGSMERVDRAESVKRAFALLAAQLTKDDEVTLIGFARTPRLLAERMTGDEAAKLADIVANPLTEGGTNLEAALTLGQQMARQQFLPAAQNRLILLTDGAANLGDALPKNLSQQVASMRALGIAFDACGVGADGLNDEVLSALAKQGDGRYYFLDRPEDADAGFAKQIAGALRPAAKNVKVQILFNPERVSKFKLYGFEKHQLKKQDFRNDAIDAAEMAAEESGVALYHFEPIPEGRGDVGTVSVRFLDTASSEMVERTWAIPYQAEVALFSEAKASLRLAATAGLFAEKLKASPVGERVELKKLRQEMELLKPIYKTQARFDELKNMLQQAGE